MTSSLQNRSRRVGAYALAYGLALQGFILALDIVKSPLARRLVALAAAYAVALSGVIASCGAVRAAVADATSSDIVICRPTLLSQTAPGGRADLESQCCGGCLIKCGAVPPPSASSVALEDRPGQLLMLPAMIGLRSVPSTRSHQSRAPPQKA